MVPRSDDITLTAADIDAAALLLRIDREEDADLALDAADRWRLAALLTWALIGAGALGWAWSLWVVSP